MDFLSRCKKSIWSPPLMRYWHKNCSFSPFSVCGGWRTTFDRLRACVLFSEYRAWVCVVLRVSRVGVFSPSCARGCVVLRVSCVGLCCPPSIARARKCILPALLSFAVINYSQSMYTLESQAKCSDASALHTYMGNETNVANVYLRIPSRRRGQRSVCRHSREVEAGSCLH